MRRLCLVLLAACHAAAGPAPAAPFDWTADLSGLDEELLSVWLGDGEAVAVGTAGALEWRAGNDWRRAALPSGTGTLWWAWGDRVRVITVGEAATVLSREAGVWSRVPTPIDARAALYGVWGDGADVWIVGGAFGAHPFGVVWRLGDAAAQTVAQPLFKIWGRWAVGAGGQILRRDGGSWTPVASGTSERIISVYGRADDDVYAVGGDSAGLVLRWDGAAWRPYQTTIEPLSGVWTAPGRGIYVAGDRGFLARFGTEEGAASGFVLSRVDFHSVAGDAERVVAVGADLEGAGGNGALVRLGATLATRIVDERPDAGPPADAPSGAGPGEPCAPGCAGDLVCVAFAAAETELCTAPCSSADQCGAYGANACCRRASPQALTSVCTPASLCN